MKKSILALASLAAGLSLAAQADYDVDSAYQVIKTRIAPEKAAELEQAYIHTFNIGAKKFLLQMYDLPVVSIEEQISNFNQQSKKIYALPAAFNKLVPKNTVVFFKLNTHDVVRNRYGGITVGVATVDANGKESPMQFTLLSSKEQYSSDPLLKSIKWNAKQIEKVKKMLEEVNCISVQNGNIIRVGYAENNIGELAYWIYPKEFTEDELIKIKADQAIFYYHRNVIFRQDGGTIGNFNSQQ